MTRAFILPLLVLGAWLIGILSPGRAAPAPSPESIWMEAETFGPLKGSNFSFMPPERSTRGSWAIAGPDAAPAFTQGGESEFMSIAARADEPGEVTVRREVEIPTAGAYQLWVRYADYRQMQEAFGVRIRQGRSIVERTFGHAPVVDELDPMKLLWGWAFAWDHVPVLLAKGPATVELYTTGPTQARRAVDCLCLTTDPRYHPTGREKPDSPTWALLRSMEHEGLPDVAPLAASAAPPPVASSWNIAQQPLALLWNVGDPWWNELQKPATERTEYPFGVEAVHVKEFLERFRSHPPVYSDASSGPVWHISGYPRAFAPGSPFLAWLDAHPERRFAILLNYGEPTWPAGADRKAIWDNLLRYQGRFAGFISGENLDYASVDEAELQRRVRAAKSRGEILAAVRQLHTAGVQAKFSGYAGRPLSADAAWRFDVPCLSATNEAFAHAAFDWGVRREGHENTGNSPVLARRLAFLRGAARQFGRGLVDYQSCNLGDAGTNFARETQIYPGSSRYVKDNQYDVWAGAGTNWLLKDYLLWYLAGAEAVYHEEGQDIYWKPGGGAAGDNFPLQLSPKGEVAAAIQRIAGAHPRGAQYTPVAFLVDEAHGWAQERFQPGGFGLDPQWNPALLTSGHHEASLRGWFDVAYFPAPETQNEPATAIRQTYVNGIFGDVFDVIANAPGRTGILSSYPVVIAAGEVPVSDEWGAGLRRYVERGGTLVVCADELRGPGAARLGLPAPGRSGEADSFRWTNSGAVVSSTRFRYRILAVRPGDRVLASAPDGATIAVLRRIGAGHVLEIGVPLGLGIDDRPVPLLARTLRHLVQGLVPVEVRGDVEWILNRLDGSWVVTLLNNRGIVKPEHGVLPTDQREAQEVDLRVRFPVAGSEEWMTGSALKWMPTSNGSTLRLTVPAGMVRMIAFRPARR